MGNTHFSSLPDNIVSILVTEMTSSFIPKAFLMYPWGEGRDAFSLLFSEVLLEWVSFPLVSLGHVIHSTEDTSVKVTAQSLMFSVYTCKQIATLEPDELQRV